MTKNEEEKKYYWLLCGHTESFSYLNEDNGEISISSKIETDDCKTRFTEREYLTIAKEHGFDRYMFAKEEIE